MTLKHLNILLADDDTDDCIFFKKALRDIQLQATLTTVNDGEQLMEYLHASITKTSNRSSLPDILFLDLNMPRKNGFECLSEIKLNDNLKQLPIIIFSTSFEQEVVNQLYINGAQHFIRKPADFGQFKKIIQQSLILIANENTEQPSRDGFVLTVQNN